AWKSVEGDLRAVLDGPDAGRDGSRSLLVEVPGGAGRRVHAELHRLESGSGEDYLVLLSDARAMDALEADARLLRQLGGLARLYRTMAHEIKAPLSGMMINLDLLRESLVRAPEPDRETAPQQYVQVLRDELHRLNRSLSAILTQTLPDAKPQDFDLAASLGDLPMLIAPQARRQGREHVTARGERAILVRGSPDRLRQAFLNVAVNALEAMPRGGRLALEAGVDGQQVRVALRDTGPGIDPDALARIYDLDFSTKEGGSGIG